ncbi:hypothetical protein A3D80_04415 [Candidatus Roizmanbacteria bacterium RIFCSPHIGHO2_02_FULL_40_13b]|uniref:OmpR/PhoB-type domain-containing protein n=1 Tax=Candidatus Roizmanbacteria bacterium RIFCSPHIGHO2_01_FULL_39_24 TaxID=1802032 RepID=A0A1F7GFK9_9BACT|nr:MAG: hypothetical protein A2799_04425 [Candidatus Roizmanbacteria bacterium RIFCSPHIGHO2_01_FULL_39_24]OGK26411.1 MAG: hypothetical protein A3D80_04415 [Candidatus Roizmanbacteria bacterium RIFCSPHIGHO2_02_FULL_40_13b]OGK49174.1 MAG: hypothetical protein A3A56_02830 [Candidatus Roizmanbacteria bacterium RIFCSPLOWO2_01_FULL_40_32]
MPERLSTGQEECSDSGIIRFSPLSCLEAFIPEWGLMVWKDERGETELSPTQSRILQTLIDDLIHWHSTDDLETRIWGVSLGTNLLAVNIRSIRMKIEPDPHNPIYLLSKPRFGYRFNQYAETEIIGTEEDL